MIGTPTNILVRVSRRLSDEAYGSYEVAAELEVNLPADANLEESFDTLDTWLTSAVAKSMSEKKAAIQKAQPVAEISKPPVQETRVPVEEAEKEYKTIDVDHFEITVGADNIRTCKVFGGPYKKFGVRCWPEPLEGVGIKLDTLEAGKFSLPEGYKKAKVLMEGDKPRKVGKFER